MHIDATRITGIFDWGCQRWGDHHYDLAWFDFWSPWHPNLNVDLLRAALQARWAAAGYVPDHEASRTRACLINIGSSTSSTNATIDRWDELDDVIRCTQVLELL